jgi:hypothetical protein
VKPKPATTRQQSLRARRRREGWQYWQHWMPPEVTAAFAQLRAQAAVVAPDVTDRELLMDLVLRGAQAAAVKTGNPGQSPARIVGAKARTGSRSGDG